MPGAVLTPQSIQCQLSGLAYRPRTHREGDHFHFSRQIFILSREGLAGGAAWYPATHPAGGGQTGVWSRAEIAKPEGRTCASPSFTFSATATAAGTKIKLARRDARLPAKLALAISLIQCTKCDQSESDDTGEFNRTSVA